MKKISEMSREEYVGYRVSEMKTDQKEVEELWTKFETEFIEKGCSGTDLADRVKRRISSHYIQQDRFPTEVFQGIVIGVIENDFGARRQYLKAVKGYKENPQSAIESGLVNMDGLPIKQAGFDKGAVIDIENSTQRTYIGLFKLEKEDKFTKGSLVARGKNMDKKPALFSLLQFRASKSKKQEEGKLLLNVSAQTDFVVNKELSEDEVKLIIKDNYPDNLLSISNLKEYAEANAENYDRLSIVIGDVFQIIDDDGRTKVDEITGKTIVKNTVLGLNKKDTTDIVVCYGLPDFPFNFQEIAQDVIAVGQPRVNKTTGEVVMMLYGACAPSRFKKEKLSYVEPTAKKAPTTPTPAKTTKPEGDW